MVSTAIAQDFKRKCYRGSGSGVNGNGEEEKERFWRVDEWRKRHEGLPQRQAYLAKLQR
jgi:hypothetical protein